MPLQLNQKYDLADPDIVSVLDELPLWSAAFGAQLLDKIKFKNGINVLDIGCGTGFPLLEIAQRFGSNANVYGIDPWKQAIERINLKIRTMQLTNVTAVEGVAEKLPFPGDFFSLIVSNNGTNNVQDHAKVISECFRVSKKDVQFVFTVNLPETMIEFYSVFESVLNGYGLKEEIIKMKKHILSKRKTVEMISDDIIKSGFIINNIEYSQFKMRYINGTAMLNHFFIKLAFLESWVNIVPEKMRTEIFECIEQKLNKTASEQGEIALTIPFACFDLGRK